MGQNGALVLCQHAQCVCAHTYCWQQWHHYSYNPFRTPGTRLCWHSICQSAITGSYMEWPTIPIGMSDTCGLRANGLVILSRRTSCSDRMWAHKDKRIRSVSVPNAVQSLGQQPCVSRGLASKMWMYRGPLGNEEGAWARCFDCVWRTNVCLLQGK